MKYKIEQISCIYSIVNLINNKIYIGSSVNYKKRITKHKWRLSQNIHHSPILQNAWNKYGKDNFSFQIIEIVHNISNKFGLTDREQVWIDFFKPEYNVCKTAHSMLGFKHSEQSKEKLRITRAKNNKPSPLKGRKFSQERIDNMRKTFTGKKYSEETNKKKGRSGTQNASYGTKHNEEIREKMRMGQKRFDERRQKELYQFDLSGNIIETHKGITSVISKTNNHSRYNIIVKYRREAINDAINRGIKRYNCYWSYSSDFIIPKSKTTLPEILKNHENYNKDVI